MCAYFLSPSLHTIHSNTIEGFFFRRLQSIGIYDASLPQEAVFHSGP